MSVVEPDHRAPASGMTGAPPRPAKAPRAFDTIVIGAGSAGSVLANRLSADPARRVLLVEAGARERSVFIAMPAGFPVASTARRFSWGYASEPEPALDGRRVPCPRGRLVGGSSAINAMCFVRGHRLDFAAWAERAGSDWSYEACLPHFRRIERFSGGADAYRGADGPLPVRAPPASHTLDRAFLEACREAGHPIGIDTNGADQEGFGPMEQTIAAGRRATAATAFLDPVRARPNLAVLTRAEATRLLVERGRVTGVEIRRGRTIERVAAGEVVLAAGAINTPKLLLLSGIGPAADLARHGIAVVADRPEVGRNLQDHVDVSLAMACARPVSKSPLLAPHRKALLGLQWLLSRTGPGATNHFEVAGYVRTRPDLAQPDIQYCFIPMLAALDGSAAGPGHGFQVTTMLLRPESRGAVTLRDADPLSAPRLLFNYLAAPSDTADLREGLRALRRILAQPAMRAYAGAELRPGPGAQTDAALDAFIRATAKSTHHPAGTCRMGLDEESVVDPAGRVRGVAGLRIADASVFPAITSGNINAPVMMVADKIAQAMLDS